MTLYSGLIILTVVRKFFFMFVHLVFFLFAFVSVDLGGFV